MTPRDLVCTRCWRDFFDTEGFEKCFTRGHERRSIETFATTSEIRDADCTWCAYVRSFIRDSWMPEDRVTTRFSPSSIGSCTPEGRNVFHLDVSCYSPNGKCIGGSSLFLHAMTTSDDIASEYVTARPLRTDVHSEAAKEQLRTWSEECMGHERCRASLWDSVLPTRVIEVSPPGGKHPRLLESGQLRGVYATLSYCWGTKPFANLTGSNYGEFIKELDPQTLPLTFRHAISIARTLSIPYLWIDALCIIQDSEDDKVREMALMKRIYASSALTTVVASAENVFEGFLHPRVHSEISHTIPVRIRPGVFGTMSVNELDAACYDERLEPIAKRAWTMQEQILAQRTLTFTTHTMRWRCSHGTRNFGDSLYFPHDLDMGYSDDDEKYSLNLHSLLLREEEARVQKDKALSCWMRLVMAYSLRVATLERDKLNAIAGVASHDSFSRILGPGYFAGLWQYNLARQLVWGNSRWHRALSNSDTMTYRPANYRAPSWSWASVEGGIIRFDFHFDEEDAMVPEVVCEIIDCSTVPRSAERSPFGEVCSARLRVKAAVRRAWFNPPTNNIFLLSASTSIGSITPVPHDKELITFAQASKEHFDSFRARHPDVDLCEEPEATFGTDLRNMCGKHDETGNHDPVMVFCVAITLNHRRESQVDGLILLLSEVNGDNCVFRRIGFFQQGRSEDFRKEDEIEISIT